ncbi:MULTISPECIES: hypothetical protein [Paracoccus]|uniref:hypothetical protein n=1 Tax=Paracoccus TaxID=265 RepID=UPI00086AC1BE|nr:MULTISPECIES: hypothetical protein [Paracoccus]ODT60965.1 MAG: hypothetical protein ABS73_03765 [Paracoccus sp. SCN 68-21]
MFGPAALAIRIALYAIGGALTWTGAVTMTGADNACINIPLLAETLAGGTATIVGGVGTVLGSFVWSRFASRKPGGVT